MDFGERKDIYYRAGVSTHVIVDAREVPGRPRRVRIRGFHAGPHSYEVMELDENGRLWLEPVRVSLGVVDGHVACFDPDDGKQIGDYFAQRQGRLAAEAQAAESEARATEAMTLAKLSHTRAARAEARAARADAQVAEAVARAAGAQATAVADARARAELERRVRELEAKLNAERRE
jgi:colicin import membrane protein